MPSPSLVFDIPPYRLSGVVVGPLLNHRDALAALGNAVNEPPYKAPPKAPILYIKPRNTWLDAGEAIVVPADVRRARDRRDAGPGDRPHGLPRRREAQALDFVAGYVIVNDVSVPHDVASTGRRCASRRATASARSGRVSSRAMRSADPMRWAIAVSIDGETVQRASTAGLIRSVARLIADVTEFMTLAPGDVLIGRRGRRRAARARRPDASAIAIDGLGRLDNPLVAEGAPHDRPA